VDGHQAARQILDSAGTQKPVLIYMTGDLMDSAQGGKDGNEPFCLQKPFRISDVLVVLRDVLAATPAETRDN
jgi:hypothetical protein